MNLTKTDIMAMFNLDNWSDENWKELKFLLLLGFELEDCIEAINEVNNANLT